MLSLSASTDHTGPRYSMAGYSHRWRKCEKLPISGCKAITKNDPMTHWEACPQLCSVSDCSQGKILLLNCLLDGGAYGMRCQFAVNLSAKRRQMRDRMFSNSELLRLPGN